VAILNKRYFRIALFYYVTLLLRLSMYIFQLIYLTFIFIFIIFLTNITAIIPTRLLLIG